MTAPIRFALLASLVWLATALSHPAVIRFALLAGLVWSATILARR